MSTSNPLQQRLLALPAITKRSGLRRMADVLPEIEIALASGASRSAVVEALKGDGIEMTLATFSANLHQLRKKASPGRHPAQLPVALASPPGPAQSNCFVGETPHRFGQHDPRRLDDVLRSAPDMKAFAKLAKKG